MKLAKCPNCQAPQSFRKIVFLTNFGTKVCSSCNAEYQVIKPKAIPATFLILIPLLFGQHIPVFNSIPFGSFAWAVIGSVLYFKYLPLEVVRN
ncbi:hypothetical protein SD909_004214 [Vibrio parahaemolyticus]|nr:hypothetical protein [Vibrio parahaemolyticus]